MPESPFSTSNLHTGDSRKRFVFEDLEIMSPDEVPMLKLLGINGEPATNPVAEWIEDTLLAESSTLGEAGFDSSETDLTVPAAQGLNFQKGNIIRLEDEYLYVTAVTADVLTVVRGVNGSTAAAHANGTVIEIVGIAVFENADSPRKAATDLSLPYNRIQAFDTSYQISDIAANTSVYGVPEGDEAREYSKAFSEIMVKLEKTAILGRRSIGATDTSAGVPSTMGGLDYYLSAAYGTNHVSVDLNGGDVTEADLNTLLQGIYYQVGGAKMARTLLVGAWNKRRISDIYAPSHRTTREDRTGGVVVDKLDTEFGSVDVVLSFRVPKNKIYAVNLKYISIHPYRNLAFFDQELAKSGAYTIRQIYGVYTMRVRNTRSMGVIEDTSTAPAA